MTNLTSIRDEELTAFLDDELDPNRREAIEAALQIDPLLSRRLDSLRIPRDDIASAFDVLTTMAPETPELPQTESVKTRGSFLNLAAMAACLLIGGLAGSLFSSKSGQRDGWMDYVAAYQALYVNETLSTITQSETQGIKQLEQLGEVVGRDLNGARSVEGIDFKRAQLLGFEGKPLVQIAYLSPRGEPMALCIIRSKAATDSAIKTTRLEGMSSAHWTRRGFAFLLIGGDDDRFISEIAERVSSSI